MLRLLGGVAVVVGGVACAPPTTDLFHQTFGDPKNPPVVFLHGGPGGNDYGFELTLAPKVAELGYYVVTYDQRGSARSPQAQISDYNYAGSTKDLHDLIGALNLKDPVLLGHSFGGTVSMELLSRYPDDARGAVLIATPINMPAIYFGMHNRCMSVYRARFDTQKVEDLATLHQKMFPMGLTPPYTYGPQELMETMKTAQDCGLMGPGRPTVAGLALYLQASKPEQRDLIMQLNGDVGAGYQTVDHVGYRDFSDTVTALKDRLAGLYGDDDGFIGPEAVATAQTLLGPAKFTSIKGGGHMLFVDNPDDFLDALVEHVEALRKRQ